MDLRLSTHNFFNMIKLVVVDLLLGFPSVIWRVVLKYILNGGNGILNNRNNLYKNNNIEHKLLHFHLRRVNLKQNTW